MWNLLKKCLITGCRLQACTSLMKILILFSLQIVINMYMHVKVSSVNWILHLNNTGGTGRWNRGSEPPTSHTSYLTPSRTFFSCFLPLSVGFLPLCPISFAKYMYNKTLENVFNFSHFSPFSPPTSNPFSPRLLPSCHPPQYKIILYSC